MKGRRCQFRIDKITYSNRSVEQRIMLPKISLQYILNNFVIITKKLETRDFPLKLLENFLNFQLTNIVEIAHTNDRILKANIETWNWSTLIFLSGETINSYHYWSSLRSSISFLVLYYFVDIDSITFLYHKLQW